ncbi:hypothetical protein NMG60_11001579 [Bertholletia excelsa]
MARHISIRHPSSVHRRQSLLSAPVTESSSLSPRPAAVGYGFRRLKEVAGGTMAECAVIGCCCPCTVVDLLVLTVYKLPAGICRRALRRRRRRKLLEKGLLPQRSCRCDCGCDDTEVQIHPFSGYDSPAADKSLQFDSDVILQLERETWTRFHGAGFWRSPSQRCNA